MHQRQFGASYFDGIFAVTVNQDHSLRRMVEDGWIDYVDPAFFELFRIKGAGIVHADIGLLKFYRGCTSSNVAISEMTRRGYEPARVEHGLALNRLKPAIQRQSPFVCLGSLGRDDRHSVRVACFEGHSTEVRISLHDFDGGWDTYFRFACMRVATKIA